MASSAEPEHWRFKLPVVYVQALACVALAGVMAAQGLWFTAVLFVLAGSTAVPQVVVIRTGRNPRWTRGFFDKRPRTP